MYSVHHGGRYTSLNSINSLGRGRENEKKPIHSEAARVKGLKKFMGGVGDGDKSSIRSHVRWFKEKNAIPQDELLARRK